MNPRVGQPPHARPVAHVFAGATTPVLVLPVEVDPESEEPVLVLPLDVLPVEVEPVAADASETDAAASTKSANMYFIKMKLRIKDEDEFSSRYSLSERASLKTIQQKQTFLPAS